MKRITGHLTSKNQQWYAVLNLYDTSGKRSQKWVNLDLEDKRGSKTEASYRLNEVLSQYNTGDLYLQEAMTHAERERNRIANMLVEDYAEFHYVFTFDSGEVDYRYRKNDKQTLVYESVAIDGKRLFTYDYEDNRGDLTGLEALTTTLNLSFRGSDSILKYAINNSALPDDHPLYRMQRFVSHMLWFRSLDENRYIGYKADSKDYYDFIFEGNMLRAGVHFQGANDRNIAANQVKNAIHF